VKDIRNAINFNQRRRGWMFQQFVKRIGSKCEVADGKAFEYGGTKLNVSIPVPHGEERTELGWVIMATLESQDQKMLYTSDVQGPMSTTTTRLILKQKPDFIILGGPPTYLEGVKVEKASIQKGIGNAARIAGSVPEMVLEHHSLRAADWRDQTKPVYDAGTKAGHKVVSAAEYLNVPPLLLESRREDLYKEEPPAEDFQKWSRLPRGKQRIRPPPV
jgi:predicted metallo-beta-lactamase superfamily hydrolase